jgi:hypothetical protein
MSGDNVERALGPAEAIFWLGDSVCRYNVVTYAEVDGPLDPEAVRRALATLQARYPRLGTTIETPAGGEPRFRRTSSLLGLRVATGEWIAEVNAELEERFTEGQAPARCVLVPHGEGRTMLLFVFNHAVGDGMSATFIVRDLLAAVAGDGAAASRALVPSRDFGPVEELLTPRGGAVRILWEVLKMTFRIVKKGLPHQIPKDARVAARERRTRFTSVKVDGALAQALVERARKEQTTVHCALAAALSLAVADELPAVKSVRIDCLSAVNVRKDLNAPVEDAMGMFAASVPVVFQVARGDELWAASRRARADLAASLERGEQLYLVPYLAWMGRQFARLARKRGVDKAAKFLEGLGSPTFALSNIGVVSLPTTYGALALRSIGFCAGAGFTNHFSCFVSTLDGVMCWSFVWMAPLIGDERAGRIMRAARARLEAAVAAA